jgi:hypothetical protein
MELIRKISQIFESLYWYRWRHYKDNELTLPNCWSGSWSIYKVMLDKLEHIMYGIKKYSDIEKRYIPLFNVSIDTLSEEEQSFIKEWAKKVFYSSNKRFYCGFRSCDENTSHDKCFRYYISFNKSNQIVVEKSTQVRIPREKIKPSSRLYTIKNGKTEEVEQYEKIYDCIYVGAKSDNAIKEGCEILSEELGKEITFIDTIINSENVIIIRPEDYKSIPETLKNKIKGTIPQYHQMWQFRKMFKKFMEDEFEQKKNTKQFIDCMKFLKKYGEGWWM